MNDPSTIALIAIGVLCLLGIALVAFLLLSAIGLLLAKTSDARSWRALRKLVKEQSESERADTQWKAAGRGLGYDVDSLSEA